MKQLSDIYRQGLDEVEKVPLSKSFPVPKYKKLLESGVEFGEWLENKNRQENLQEV